jgi:hypothetical protein
MTRQNVVSRLNSCRFHVPDIVRQRYLKSFTIDRLKFSRVFIDLIVSRIHFLKVIFQNNLPLPQRNPQNSRNEDKRQVNESGFVAPETRLLVYLSTRFKVIVKKMPEIYSFEI